MAHFLRAEPECEFFGIFFCRLRCLITNYQTADASFTPKESRLRVLLLKYQTIISYPQHNSSRTKNQDVNFKASTV
jgi:hypothetical protein